MQKIKETQNNKQALLSNVAQDNPTTHYVKGCIKEEVLVLPLFNYVKSKTLVLQSYALSKGHCRALAEACRDFDDQIINLVMFDNCNIDDYDMSFIIKACLSLKDFKSIVYKQNAFGELSLALIPQLLQ